MGRKHQNRRGKVGRRARARKAANSLEEAEKVLGLKGGKFDVPPKASDDSVLSTKKHSKLPEVEEVETPVPVVSQSRSKAKHAEMRLRGEQRKVSLQTRKEISKSTSVPLLQPAIAKSAKSSVKFGDRVDGPANRVASLGAALAKKLRKYLFCVFPIKHPTCHQSSSIRVILLVTPSIKRILLVNPR